MKKIVKKENLPPGIHIVNIYNMNESTSFGPQPQKSEMQNRRYYTDRLFTPHIVSIGQGKCNSADIFFRKQIHPNAVEFYYIANGIFDMELDGRRYIIKSGDLFMVPPDVWHQGGALQLQKPNFFWLIIRIPSGKETFLGLSAGQTERLFSRILDLPVKALMAGLSFKTLFEDMLQALITRHEFTELLVAQKILELLLYIVTIAHSAAADKTAPDDLAIIHNAMEYIQTHIKDRILLDDLGKNLNTSPSSLKRKFKSITGISPHDYVTREKMIYAKECLHDTKRTIVNIAYDLEFSSHSHFSNTFRKWIGVTPQQYRTSLTVN